MEEPVPKLFSAEDIAATKISYGVRVQYRRKLALRLYREGALTAYEVLVWQREGCLPARVARMLDGPWRK